MKKNNHEFKDQFQTKHGKYGQFLKHWMLLPLFNTILLFHLAVDVFSCRTNLGLCIFFIHPFFLPLKIFA